METETGILADQVRRLTGASRSQLRYWETHRIITPLLVQHVSRNWRVYTQEQVDRIHRIRNLLAEGMTLQGAIRRLDAAMPARQHEAVLEPLAVA